MKTQVIANPPAAWAGVTYPVLIRYVRSHDEYAIATSADAGVRIDSKCPGGIQKPGGATWQQAGWMPVVGPITVTLEN